MLIASRVVQGAGAAWLMPCSLALIAHSFPSAHGRRRALAVWGGASGVGLASGPVLGGVLTSAFGWRAIFLVNVPVAVVAAFLLARHVGETERHRHPLDAVGLLLAAVGLSALTGAFIVAGGRSWTSVLPLALLGAGLLGAGLLAVIVFALAERKAAHPMVDPVLFRRRTFSIAVTVGVIFNFCLYGGLFCLSIALHQAHGLSVFDTGVAMLPMTLVTAVTALLSERGVARFGEWPIMAVGLAAGALGAALVAVTPAGGPTGVLVLSTVPLGLTAMAMPAMSAAAMSGTPGNRLGLASGVLNAARQTGGAFGIAILGALLAPGGGAISLHLAFAVIAGAYVIGIALAVSGLREWGSLVG
jgi:DHA2 family methylenomycin A resistance protein-like MFS transporter